MTSESLSHEALKARMNLAGQCVRDDLSLVGRRAGYSWPGTPGRIWRGYSYEIPKEEQIRSAFWAHLHDRERLVCELEWNHYESDGGLVAVGGEIDLVGFDRQGDPGAPVLLLEFKRVWWLTPRRPWSIWQNKVREMKGGIERDADKLRDVLASLGGHRAQVPLAAVVVVAFSDEPARLKSEFRSKDWVEGTAREEIWDVGEPLCEAELGDGMTPRPIYSRADLLIVS